ncbi:sulfotransferase [Kribbella sp. CA-294648]|uniref:sulfotransferase n=1 Tax=Kribbella sp. CA-294648 TaxID=3239948 RepID=UPI003D9115D4
MTKLLYLGGFGRSGTTLVERVIGQLPEVCALGEVTHLWFRGLLWDESCGCGQPFSRCDFWQQVGEVAFGGWKKVDADGVHRLGLEVDRSRYLPQLATLPSTSGLRRRAREYADWYARIYSAAAIVSGAELVVDSSKNASLAYVLRDHEGIDLRVLHVVRDARGVAHSWSKDVPRPEARSEQRSMDKYTALQSAVLWTVHNLAFEVLRRRGVATRQVRYEQLTAGPRRTLAGILSWLDLPAAELPFAADGSVMLEASHTVAGNPMRFQTGRLELRTDDAWRSRLSGSHRRQVTAVTWPLLLRYGYPAGARP